MSIAQSSVPIGLPLGVSPAARVHVVPARTDDGAGFEVRWDRWQVRGRARDAAARERLLTAGLMAVIAGALAGAVRLSFGASL